MTEACEHCRPIIEAMQADVVKLIDEVLTSDRELVRHYALRHGLIDGLPQHLRSNPRDLARGVLALLMDTESRATTDDMQRLRIRSALLQTTVRGDAT